MDYDKNCNFVVKKENNDLKVLNNKLNEKVDKLEIIKVGADNKIQNKTLISENNFFSKNSEGIFFIKIHYKKEGKSKNNTYFFKVQNGKLVLQRSSFPKDLSGSTKTFPENKFKENKCEIEPDDYFKILRFYIIENPSIKDKEPISAKFYDIKNYWGVDCWQKRGGLKQELIDTVDDYEHCVRKFNSVNDSKKSITALGLDDMELINDKIKITFEDVCNNIFLSIFRHIRNGLAHGRFCIYEFVNTQIIFIEDRKGENVTARMTIPISILLKWIDILKSKEA
ncbi:MAG: hypothetical protein GX832_07110 [Clostridiales bacterium]|nr:hypothetical protein [Clostridiales bacterium]